MALVEMNREINVQYGRAAMDVLYRGIVNFEDDPRLVEAARLDLDEFAARLARLLRRNSVRAA